MDGTRFDAAVRALGGRRSRRGVLGLLAGVAGGAPLGAQARRKCLGDSPPGQCCRRRYGAIVCVCRKGGTVCGAACCGTGQECRDGACVEPPEPVACLARGDACKNTGIPCCDGLTCGSGQGGMDDIACYVPAGGACTATSECAYGALCLGGRCAVTCATDPCPACPVGPTVPAAAVGPVCVDGACACACMPLGTGPGSWTGVRCAVPLAISGLPTSECYDMATYQTCTSSSAFCCEALPTPES